MSPTPNIESAADVREYWGMVRLHMWWILPSSLLLFLGSLMVIAVLPNYYEATTTIIVDPQKVSDQYVTTPVTTERLNTLSQQVLSTTRLQKIINHLRLYPELQGSSSREQIIDLMRRSIRVEVKEGSPDALSSFTITYQGRVPAQVAEVANELASGFVEWNLESREQQVNGTSEFLAAHLAEAKRDLESQEAKLRAYRMQYLGEMPDQQAGNIQALSGLQASLESNGNALNRLEEERILLGHTPEAMPVQRGSGQPAPNERAGLTLEKEQLQGELEALRERYTEDYPDVVAKAAELRRVDQRLQRLPPASPENRVPTRSAAAVRLEIIDRETERLRKEQARIKSQIASYQAKVDAVPFREEQLTDLTRNYEVSKELYNSLLQKTYSASMAADLEAKQKAERFTILDRAHAPEKPFKPKRPMLIGAAAAISLTLAVGLAILLEKLNGTVSTEKELAESLPRAGMLLVSIPTIQTPADRRRRVWVGILASALTLLACAATGVFLLKVHPIL